MASQTGQWPRERRQYYRIDVKNEILAVLCYDSVTFVDVTQVSLGGLRFHCPAGENLPTEPFSISLVTSEGLLVDTLSATTIWTSPVIAVSSPKMHPLRRYGVSFLEVTADQMFRLNSLLRIPTENRRNLAAWLCGESVKC
jgi:hypothetical protein